MEKTVIAAASAPPAGPYSPGLAVGGWVFLAGQVGASLLGDALVEITVLARLAA